MAITYRTLKGAPLSADELDQNFRELQEKLLACEEVLMGHMPVNLARVYLEGNEIIFESTAKEILGRISFPPLTLEGQGT